MFFTWVCNIHRAHGLRGWHTFFTLCRFVTVNEGIYGGVFAVSLWNCFRPELTGGLRPPFRLLGGYELMVVDRAWAAHEKPVQAAFLRVEYGVPSLEEQRFFVTVDLHVGDDCSMCAGAEGVAPRSLH